MLQRRLTFDNSAQMENLNDFTVLVKLNGTRIDYGRTRPSGTDIRFTDSDGTTPIAYEIERWNDGSSSFVWVQVPRVDASSTVDSIVMYYDNPGAPDASRPAATWDASYEAVWHLDPALDDSTTNGHGGTDMGSSRAAGYISRGRHFGGGGQQVVTDRTVGSAPDLTFSFWMRSEVDTGFHRPIEKRPGSGTQGWSVLQRPVGDTFPRGLIFRVGSSSDYGGWGNEVSASNVYAVNTWVHVVGTYESASSTGKLYIDGSMVDEVTNTDARGVANTDDELVIGSADGFERFVGDIDEVRISSVARSPAHVAAQFLSESDAFVTFGAEEPVGLTCPE